MKLSIYGPRLVLALSLLSTPSWPQQNGSLTESSVPVYQVKFNAGEPVSGIGGIHAISLPFGCAELGTVFITMVQPTGGVGSGNRGPNTLSLLLVSVSLSGEAHSFPLNQVPNLHDVENLGQSESDSNVLFLVRATAKDSGGQSLMGDHRPIRKPAERQDYILVFDRQGSYQREMAVDAPMRAIEIGQLPSGGILLYGCVHDRQFVSFDLAGDRVLRLVGTAEPVGR